MDIEVISVSRRVEKLSETASAIQVITREDIHRSGATTLADALRLAPNVRVGQVNSYAWVVTTRGFSGIFANKLLVMIDGRTVYTPLFAGVLWDVQNPLLEDLEQIEVVSGPGGTLWGANAVNGVINIQSKNARDTQGLYVSAAAGSQLEHYGAVRYGGKVGETLHYRAYVHQARRDNTLLPNGGPGSDAWEMAQGGFRLDWEPTADDTITWQGDLNRGTEFTAPANSTAEGQNLLGRWTRTLSPDSDLKVQVYFDRTWRRDIPSTFTDKLKTYDFDFQHRFAPLAGHRIVWGAGYRRMLSEVRNSGPIVAFVPNRRNMDLFSGFIQDEVPLAAEQLRLTVGTKLEHNVFSGFEVQPSIRLAWIPTEQSVLWASISRAVRSPSRIDVDYFIPATPAALGTPGVFGGPNFTSEKVFAYEAGYRTQPTAKLSLSLATFYNRYDDVYSVEAVGSTPSYQIQNGTEGQSYGVELSGTYSVNDWWRLKGGGTWFRKDLWNKPGHFYNPAALGNDPARQFLVQSMWTLPRGFQFDVVARHVSSLPDPAVPAYTTFDARLAWENDQWEISVVGQDLGDDRHGEFGVQTIRRSAYGKISWRF